ncbi:type 4b pilus protein PilO2 [Salmonella enterica subsp. enterica serovar Carmel]|nr:type 4b pilus protein PilO2 [Salmonella enterica subsp. enterica serovar Carmel]
MLTKSPPRCVFTCVAILLIILIIVLFFFLRSPQVPDYVTAPARLGNIESAVLATGRIDAIERVNVGAQVSGQVKSLKVKLGDRVTKGQPIADIDDVLQRNDLRNAEAALNVIKAELRAKQALLRQAELRFKRQRQMLSEDARPVQNWREYQFSVSTPLNPDELFRVFQDTGVRISSIHFKLNGGTFSYTTEGHVYASK